MGLANAIIEDLSYEAIIVVRNPVSKIEVCSPLVEACLRCDIVTNAYIVEDWLERSFSSCAVLVCFGRSNSWIPGALQSAVPVGKVVYYGVAYFALKDIWDCWIARASKSPEHCLSCEA